MKAEAQAVLLLAKQRLSSKDKAIGTVVPKVEGRVRIALPDAGREDWVRFKRECVLLRSDKKGGGK